MSDINQQLGELVADSRTVRNQQGEIFDLLREMNTDGTAVCRQNIKDIKKVDDRVVKLESIYKKVAIIVAGLAGGAIGIDKILDKVLG